MISSDVFGKLVLMSMRKVLLFRVAAFQSTKESTTAHQASYLWCCKQVVCKQHAQATADPEVVALLKPIVKDAGQDFARLLVVLQGWQQSREGLY
jgi:hypothetical protein